MILLLRLSSSAPTHLGLEQIWQRREPRKHLLSTSSLVEAGSTSSLSTGGLLSPEIPDFSLDEESDDDSDAHYEDFSSDNGKCNLMTLLFFILLVVTWVYYVVMLLKMYPIPLHRESENVNLLCVSYKRHSKGWR